MKAVRKGLVLGWACMAMAAVAWAQETAPAAAADEVGDALRRITAEQGDAVIRVRLDLKQRFSMPGMGSETEESTSEIQGTVISPDGLVVVSLQETDPTSMFASMAGMFGEDEGFDMSSTISDATYILADGKEVTAKVVLRDRDLDLAFLRPETALDQPIPYVDLTRGGDAKTPVVTRPFERVIVLGRMGEIAKRMATAYEARIPGIIERPRRTYVLHEYSAGGLGTPAFTLDGRPVGIVVSRMLPAGAMGMSAMMGGFEDSMMTIILPAPDVSEIASQAPQEEEAVEEESAPAEEPAGEAPEDDAAPADGE